MATHEDPARAAARRPPGGRRTARRRRARASDTRSLLAGDLFVALRGERFDANDFAAGQVGGAVAALAERGDLGRGRSARPRGGSTPAPRCSRWAGAWRAQHGLPLIAVTGSNGKTTVTQMIAAILRAWHGEAAPATPGNLNNDIGVPMTLLRLRDRHRAAVVELGMNHPARSPSSRRSPPTVALVNNAQREHQEFMASVEAVARENGSVIAALPADGWRCSRPTMPRTRRCGHKLAGRAAPDALRHRGPRPGDGRADWKGDHWRCRCARPPVRAALHMAGRAQRAQRAAARGLRAGGRVPARCHAGLEAFSR